MFNFGNRDIRSAHRVAWEFTNGPIPHGWIVCHRCDNPACCNPDHLFLGTHADNVADKVAKGRAVNPLADACRTKTHCPKGHAYDEANTGPQKGGSGRTCRACARARYHAQRQGSAFTNPAI